jgi:tetratricopeptide (TPR) repeat protein
MAFWIVGCAHNDVGELALSKLEPLRYEGTITPVHEALREIPDNDLLALSPEMKEFSDRYIRANRNSRTRLRMLHRSLSSKAMVGMQYNPHADGSAAQAFASGEANCLSYAHLFVALARYSGLNARYQSLTLRPEWSRHGDRVALRRHVNVVIRLRGNEEYMVDIDPVSPERVTRVDELTDAQAHALQDNNLAMTALLEENIGDAWKHALRALQRSPDTDYLWVNLGAIYRQAGQDAAAEKSYFQALALNPNSRSAMNNLVVLYTDLGQVDKALEWDRQVEMHRRQNPYYYAHLAEVAEGEGDLELALAHYQRALARQKEDPDLYFQVGKIYLAMHQPQKSIHYVELAIKHARMAGEREAYRAYLSSIGRDALAVLDQEDGRTRM